jgi:hypothetical protein
MSARDRLPSPNSSSRTVQLLGSLILRVLGISLAFASTLPERDEESK